MAEAAVQHVIESIWRRGTAHIDGPLMIAVSLLLAVGMITLYSASNQSIDRMEVKLFNLGVAFAVMWVVANTPMSQVMRLAMPAYLLALALLVAVALVGDVRNGARRWLDLGFLSIQPSELMKITLPLALAWYFDRYESTLKLSNFAIAAALFVLPVGLIAEQPDLGTALLIAASGCYVLFLAGLPWKVMFAMGAAGVAGLPLLWSVMHDYQRTRVMTLLDPTQDPLGAGYHTIQSTIAVGSGGWFGKGWLEGTQTHLDFLPERTTDFIFAVYSEEFGLLGNAVLLLLFLLVVARGLVITLHAPTVFTRLVAGSVTMTFATYAFVNMGMVSGILPVVGVPLPLISYGGTALVSAFFGFGLLMSISTNRKLIKS
ncbi:MAG: rod shape-determining protein RodA [Burkholderiales bacterium]|nr:rod shape-determining protein RodA [Burkholderiales bacterium]